MLWWRTENTYFFKNGNKQYEGNWINHKFDEKGILYYNNEKNTPYYRGTVFKNNITGKGIYYDFHGKKNYQGDVFHDKRHGKGTEYTHDGKVVYFGNWQRNNSWWGWGFFIRRAWGWIREKFY